MSARVTLVLGGARSGKSRHAEALARQTGLSRIYLATAQPFDEEMRERIRQHRADRDGDGWQTIEEPLDLAGAIARASAGDAILLVDCLTLWLSNLMLAGHPVIPATQALMAALAAANGPVILVSNEVGLGIVPETPLGRAFRDAQGRLNQNVASLADHVVFMAAGLPLTLKEPTR
ncbi:MAG: bifunctional adenosylcobinamide kinase/adenosylcobinamide-phosphate guanylyltransferase [Beijerinckiaceae bacterium]|nr:bifunctional adenosylcobinamide kinase/adenosylcobinamide-phosphate guanylyltransferase [Beijerinckiaceae bacterium]MCZ8299986.1 bifunctional adenosylcobinamide kinase/adenosylcobinamide-phosphate guanylyltransferase [Beijerinckiaceae bacterium]